MSELIVKAENLQKTFYTADGKHRRALRGVSFEVKKGEAVALLGPSGSGKSTCLRALGALETLDGGTIEICGQSMSHYSRKPHLIRRKTAMVFQHFELFPHLNVLDNVSLALRVVQNLPRPHAEQKAAESLREVNMDDYARSFPAQLSGGQKQRVAIARALATEPALLLCDEPTSALDPELVREFSSLLAQVAARGMTMVVVTHSMSFARKVASRCLFLEEGHLWCDLKSEDFFSQSRDVEQPTLSPEGKTRLNQFLSIIE